MLLAWVRRILRRGIVAGSDGIVAGSDGVRADPCVENVLLAWVWCVLRGGVRAGSDGIVAGSTGSALSRAWKLCFSLVRGALTWRGIVAGYDGVAAGSALIRACKLCFSLGLGAFYVAGSRQDQARSWREAAGSALSPVWMQILFVTSAAFVGLSGPRAATHCVL